MKQEKVIEKVYNPGRLRRAWQQVKKNDGVAGIDRMTIEEFAKQEDELLKLIHEKLKAGTCRFKPARRVLIPKEGTSRTNFGFIRGRSQHRKEVRFVLNLKWFRKQGLLFLEAISLVELLNCRSVADRGAAYLAGTSRSVGRGWPLRPFPTRFTYRRDQNINPVCRERIGKEVNPIPGIRILAAKGINIY